MMAPIRISRSTGIVLGFLLQYGIASAHANEGNQETLSELVKDIETGHLESALPELQDLVLQKYPGAAFALGLLFRDGIAVRRDFTEARNLFAQGAFLGDPAAMNALGLLYRDGLGLSADPVEAYAWFRVAAEKGHTVAETHRDEIESGLNDEKRASGRALALRRELEIELLAQDRIKSQPKLHTAPASTESNTIVAKVLHQPAAEEQSPIETTDQTGTSAPAVLTTYVVQIGVFAQTESIENIRSQAKALGLALIETDRTVDGRQATRIEAGPFADEEQAANAAARLNDALAIDTTVEPLPP